MVALTQNLYVYDAYGLVEGNVGGPLRPSLCFWGDGMFMEPGTTNLLTNPSFETNLTGVTTGGTAPTLYQSVLRCWAGSKSLLINWGAGSGTVIQNFTAGATGTYVVQARVWVPAGSPAVTLTTTAGTATISSPTTATSNVTGKWQRLTATVSVTVAGTVNMVMSTSTTPGSGQFAFTDAWQAEAGSAATTYCDGAQATVWNAAGALATYDFETGTSSWVPTNGTLTQQSGGGYSGSYDLRLTASGANATASSPIGTSGIPVTPGKVYTAIAWVKGSASRTGYLGITFYDASGNSLGNATNTFGPTAMTTSYQKYGVTYYALTNAAYMSVFFVASNSVAADTFDIDAVRVEEGTASGAYHWTGAEHASTSMRAQSTLSHPLPGGLLNGTNDWSFSIRATVMYNTAATTQALFGVFATLGNFLYVYLDASGNLNSQYAHSGTGTAGPSIAIGAVAGDQLLVAVAVTASTGTITLYASKNGAATVSASLTNAAYQGAWGVSTVSIGSYANNYPAACAFEHALFYTAAIASGDFESLRTASSEPTYAGDTRITYAYLTGTDRNISQALSANGTGRTRQRIATTCYLENNLAQTNLTSDDDSSTTKITVATGSGIGVGDTVSLSAGTSTAYTVKRVLAAGGAYDELWVA